MTDETTLPNSSAPAQGTSETPPVQSLDASTQALEKPSWLPDDKYFDAEKGVNYDELGKNYRELSEFKSQLDKAAEARKAEMPEKADGYGFAPEDYKLPDNYKLDTESPMWKLLQETAYEKGMTKAEYSEMATKFIEASNAHQDKAVKAFNNQRDEMMKQLGPDSTEQISALKSWFKSVAPDEAVASQLGETLWTPGIVRFMQAVQKQLTSQGAAGFSGLGRDGAGGNDDADYSKLTFEQKWARSQQRRAG
jgi:hypothetical protein